MLSVTHSHIVLRTRFRRPLLFLTSLVVFAVLLVAAIAIYYGSGTHLPYRWPLRSTSLASGRTHGWHAYGGTWQLFDGVITETTDARGAKLMSGSPQWMDYLLDADIEPLGGSAGLVVRASDEERGVDSYSGYYAGLRAGDSSMLIGRADHGWEEYASVRLPHLILPFHWYHLRLIAVGCSIAAQVIDPSTGESRSVRMHEDAQHCAIRGRIGLRSVLGGAAWRNIAVAAATKGDLAALDSIGDGNSAMERPRNLRQLLERYRVVVSPSLPTESTSTAPVLRQPIGNLRFASTAHSQTVVVHGEVELLHPVLFVQDATGGASVPDAIAPPLQLGDEVEVQGEAVPHSFGSSIMRARVKLLWPGAPSPPLSISVLEASTGAYDGRFVELQGRLDHTTQSGPEQQTLALSSGDQRFDAILESRGDLVGLPEQKLGSTLRLRGVCSHDESYTRSELPFVILLRSPDDVQTIGGPPLWTWRNVMIASVAFAFLVLLGYLFYIRAEQWRLRAVIEERERLAHDLHDTLAQSFTGIGLQLRAILKKLPDNMFTLRRQLDDAAEMVQHGHQEARRSISTLRIKSTDSIELLPALKQAAHRIISDESINVNTSRSGDERALPLEVADVLFRIGQEAIANTVRHASASTISVDLQYSERAVSLVVDDDGCGMDSLGAKEESLGLIGVRRRVASVGGTVSIYSLPCRGTRVHAVIPIPRRRTRLRLLRLRGTSGA